jgi:hypothetical protein
MGENLEKPRAALKELYKDWNPELDRRAARRLVAAWNANSEVGRTESDLMSFTEASVVGSVPALPADGASWDAFDAAAKAHPALGLSGNLREEYAALMGELSAAEAQYQSGMKDWMAVQLAYAESTKNQIAADANSTLRVAYGRAGGFSPADGMRYTTHTTADGVLAKYRPGD